MVTLQQIYNRLSAPGVLAKAGQTGCWDQVGNPLNCAGTGQDGAFQKGISASPRFTNNGNGTVTDNLTGLTWLRNANCFGSVFWTDALDDANMLASGACGLTDGSVAGAWRLPNIRELQSLVDFSEINPALPSNQPFSGVVMNISYWSSTSAAGGGEASALDIEFSGGTNNNAPKSFAMRLAWPVRGGQ